MVGKITGGVTPSESVVVENDKDVVVDDVNMKRASGDFSEVDAGEVGVAAREVEAGKVDADNVVEHEAVRKVQKGVEKLEIAVKFLEEKKVGEAGKEAKGAAKELKAVISDMTHAEGKAKLGLVKRLAVALLKVATSLSKLCEFLAGLTIEVMGKDDKSTVTQIAKLVQSITKPINEFVKNYETKAKEKALKEVEATAAKLKMEVEGFVTAADFELSINEE